MLMALVLAMMLTLKPGLIPMQRMVEVSFAKVRSLIGMGGDQHAYR